MQIGRPYTPEDNKRYVITNGTPQGNTTAGNLQNSWHQFTGRAPANMIHFASIRQRQHDIAATTPVIDSVADFVKGKGSCASASTTDNGHASSFHARAAAFNQNPIPNTGMYKIDGLVYYAPPPVV